MTPEDRDRPRRDAKPRFDRPGGGRSATGPGAARGGSRSASARSTGSGGRNGAKRGPAETGFRERFTGQNRNGSKRLTEGRDGDRQSGRTSSGDGQRRGNAQRRDDSFERAGGRRGRAGGRDLGRRAANSAERFDREENRGYNRSRRLITDRDREEPKPIPPGLEPAENEPDLPENVELAVLPRSVRAELRGLTKQQADRVGGHLVMAGALVDEDPTLALRHAKVARRLASRLPVVREICAEVAYLAEDFDTALTEYRAIHRMSGSSEYLPVIADCERATGRHQAALRTIREAQRTRLSQAQRTELTLVEAGIRADLGQLPEALRLLKEAIQSREGGRAGQARYRYAYANLLLEAGQDAGAREWFISADNYDDEEALDSRQRIASIDGLDIDQASQAGVQVVELGEEDE